MLVERLFLIIFLIYIIYKEYIYDVYISSPVGGSIELEQIERTYLHGPCSICRGYGKSVPSAFSISVAESRLDGDE